MGIIVEESKGLFHIHTQNTTYQMKVDQQKVLLHTYYGKRIDETDLSSQLYQIDRGFSGNPYDVGKVDRSYSLDVLPQEYSTFGTGDYRITGLKVKESTGNQSCSLRYKGYQTEKGLYSIEGLPAAYTEDGSGETLKIELTDESNGLQVTLYYGVIEEKDVILRAVRCTNTSQETLTLEKVASMNLDIPFGEYDFISFYGRHAMERNVNRQRISHGVTSVGSVRGHSSHHYNPYSIVCEKTATETAGACFGFCLAYSGEFLMEVEKDQANQTRMICGIHPDDFAWVLEPGASFDTPQVIMSFSAEGLGKLSQNYHKTIQENITRGPWKKKRRPVLINNWEGTYFDFNGDKLVSMAKDAASMGVELFVMDDGWFGKRDDDNSGLGDWVPNEKKLGCTLKELGDRINAEGMLFGIWFEPEAISEDSDLYRAHPDWAVTCQNRKPELSRNELMLDFSRKDVCEYIISQLTSVLEEAPIAYVKWDMNRSVCDKYSHGLDAAHQGEFAHRFMLGLYYVLETLHQRFPEVLFEGCSGGGGRFDAGMMYYTPQIWCSDNTDAVNRLRIQYGSSFCYPVSTMGAHVSAVPNHQTGRVTSLHTRGIVAMSGTFGYELDVTKMSAEEKETVRAQIETFKRYYDVIQYGKYYRLSTPQDICTAWEYAREDGTQALIVGVFHGVEANEAPAHFAVQGLDPAKKYSVLIEQKDGSMQEKCQMSGAALQNAGLTFPQVWGDNEGVMIEIRVCS